MPLDLRQARNFVMSSVETSQGVGLGSHVLGEEPEYVLVFSVSHRFAECFDVLEKRVDGRLKRQRIRLGLFFGVVNGEAAASRLQFEPLSFLGFQRFGGRDAGGFAQTTAVLAPFDEIAAAGWPLDAAVFFSGEGGVAPTLLGADLPQDIDPRHSASPEKVDTIMDTTAR
jgi:hypothetical protein